MSTADWTKFVEVNPKVLVGKPVIKGTRLSVDFILDLFSQGWTRDQVLENYPSLNQESLQAVFSYATDALKSEYLYYFKTGTNQ